MPAVFPPWCGSSSEKCLLLSRRLQGSAGRLMLCRCYFLSYYIFFFFNDRLEQRDLENCETDLRQVFRYGRHVGVDVQSDIDFRIGQGTLPWQPSLSAKSAEIGDTRSFLGLAFNNGWHDGKAYGRFNSVDGLSTSFKNLVNFGPLIGVYGDYLATIYAPNARNHRNAFDSWDSRSTMDDRNTNFNYR